MSKQIDFKQKLRVMGKKDLPKATQEMSDQNLEVYMQKIAKRRTEILAHTKSIESARFLGKYASYIVEEFREDIERLNGTTMMIHATRSLGNASTRGTHIYNAAEIAYKIAMGIFGDEEVARGIALAALLHDIGQPAFGHDGENMASKASEVSQGGPHPHNATGAARIIFRDSRKVLKAINKGMKEEYIQKEANRRGMSKEELSTRVKEGKEPELERQIEEQIDQLKNTKKAAVRTLAMATGRHNGERGKATILPDYQIDYKEFNRVLDRCFIEEGADKEMQSANMVDAIVKISDQLSSIPYDMIDGKRGGVVLDIPESFAESIVGILGIPRDEAIKRIKGDNNKLNALVKEIQTKLIESLIENSTKKTIGMDSEITQFLYGNMRKCVYGNYLDYTTSIEEEAILEGAWINASALLAEAILDERGIFPPELNAVFRMPLNDSRRENYEAALFSEKGYGPDSEIGRFYRYILETSPEEYLSIKRQLHQYGINLLRKNIVSAREKFDSGKSSYKSDSDNIEQGIINYLHTSNEGIAEPADGENYTEEEITEINRQVNMARKAKGKPILLLQRDQRLALQLSIRYLESKFSDRSFIDFCLNMGILTEEDAKEASRKYNPAGEIRYKSGSARKSKKAYQEAEADMGVLAQEEI